MHRVKGEFTLPDGTVRVCTLKVWTRKWLDSQEVTMECENSEKRYLYRNRRSLLYNPLDLDPVKTDYEIQVEQQFNEFQEKFGRNYKNSMERDMRLRIFKSNLHKIDELNKYEDGTAVYGITEFVDFTSAEYKQRTGLWSSDQYDNELKNPIAKIPNVPLPREFDWRGKGVISSVKDQGNCGSCWAFSVTGNIEGLHAIKTGNLEEYSEQELVDCDNLDGGCNGGLPDNAYK